MPEQRPLFPHDPQAGPGNPSDVSVRPIGWTARIEATVRFLVRIYLGGLMTALPWLGYWTQNNLFTYSPTLLALSSSGFVRGMFSGLGLLNIFLAVSDLRTGARGKPLA